MADTDTHEEQSPRVFTARPRASRRPRVATVPPAPRRNDEEREERAESEERRSA
jgi:hypothetical protein